MALRRPAPSDFAETAARLNNTKALRQHYHCGPAALFRWCAEAGVKIGGNGIPTPPDFAMQAKTLNLTQLARHYGRSTVTVKRWCHASGVEPAVFKSVAPKPTQRPVPADFTAVAGTMCKRDLMRHYKAGAEVLNRWLRETGATALVPTPPPPPPRRIATALPKPRTYSLIPTASRGVQIASIRASSIHDIAASDLQRDGWTVYRCDKNGRQNEKGDSWRCGQLVIDGDELLMRAEKARRKAAYPHHSLNASHAAAAPRAAHTNAPASLDALR